MKKFLFVILSSALLIGCRSAQPLQVVAHRTTDTLYLTNLQYDSIFVYQDKYVDRSRDTILIRDSILEYRYKLIRDTILQVRVDSIPYEVRVVETREVPRPKTWFDRLCRYAFFLLCGVLLFFVYRCIRKFI